DHKFDPITNEDYYALYGIFDSTKYPWPGIELQQYQRDFVPLAPADIVAKVEKERAAKHIESEARLKALEAEKKHYERAALEALDGEAERLKEYSNQLNGLLDKVRKGSGTPLKDPLPYETVYAVTDAPKAGNAKVNIKG